MTWPFTKHVPEELLTRGKSVSTELTLRLAVVRARKDARLQRQVELFSLPNMSSELEAEYRSAASDVARGAQEALQIDERLSVLAAALLRAKEGTAGPLEKALGLADPSEVVEAALTPVRL